MDNDKKDDKLKPDDLGTVAKNFLNAMSSWQKAGRPVVSKDTWKLRLSTCRSCEWWQEVAKTQIARCKKCGCSSAKLLLGTSRCPLNPPKWTEEKKK
jgi:hypothetical protein